MLKRQAFLKPKKNPMISNTQIKDLVIFFLVVMTLPAVWYFAPKQHGVKVYDCSIAEISPDYPVEVKNECRKVRTEKIK